MEIKKRDPIWLTVAGAGKFEDAVKQTKELKW